MLTKITLTTFAAGAAGSALINFSADTGVADTSISFDGVTGGLRTDRAITIGDDNTCTKIDGASDCLSTTLANLHSTQQDVSLLGAQLTQFGQRLSELEIKTEAINAKVNPACPAKDLGTAANPATSCKDILDQRTADSSADGNCTTYLPTSGVYTLMPEGGYGTTGTAHAFCDMETEGCGWTQCLNAAFLQGAEKLYQKTYAKVYDASTTGYYDWCPQLTGGDYLLTLTDGAVSPTIKAGLKFTDSRPYSARNEWSEEGIHAKKIDNLQGTDDLFYAKCGAGGGNYKTNLNFWEYISPNGENGGVSRGLRGFQRGHFYCHASLDTAPMDVALYGDATYATQSREGLDAHLYAYHMGNGCNYGSCPDPLALPASPTDGSGIAGWSWVQTSTAGMGKNSGGWLTEDPLHGNTATPLITGARTAIFFR